MLKRLKEKTNKRNFPLKEGVDRSKFIYRSQKTLILAILLLIVSIPSFFVGLNRYGYMVKKSSSPIGTNLVFQRSNAVVKLKNIFTTKSKNALIVRLGADDTSSGALPFRGEDYNIYLRSERISKQYPNKFLRILFGKITTDGDFFLIIPNPDPDNVYEVMVMNKKYLPTNITIDGINANITRSDIEFAGNLSKALSNQQYKLNDESRQVPVIASNEYDMGVFRVALNPSLDSEKYKPIELDVDLLEKDGTFDFKLFFDKVFKENTIVGLDKEFDGIKEGLTLLNKSLEEIDERLLVNPNDAGALQKKTEITNNIANLQARQNQIVDLLDVYESINYDPSTHFNYLLDYAYILPY